MSSLTYQTSCFLMFRMEYYLIFKENGVKYWENADSKQAHWHICSYLW